MEWGFFPSLLYDIPQKKAGMLSLVEYEDRVVTFCIVLFHRAGELRDLGILILLFIPCITNDTRYYRYIAIGVITVECSILDNTRHFMTCHSGYGEGLRIFDTTRGGVVKLHGLICSHYKQVMERTVILRPIKAIYRTNIFYAHFTSIDSKVPSTAVLKEVTANIKDMSVQQVSIMIKDDWVSAKNLNIPIGEWKKLCLRYC